MEAQTKTQTLLALWKEARTRFSNQLAMLTAPDLSRKLPQTQNSVGFLLRHIGDVEFLFAKNVFGSNLSVSAKTLITQHDTGEWTDLSGLLQYVAASAEALEAAIRLQNDADWDTEITTKEFGVKTKAESLGRIISHTAHHGGQLAIVLKYADTAVPADQPSLSR